MNPAPASLDNARAVSKKLSWILRHHAVELGLQMRPDGYVRVEDLLRLDLLKSFRPPITFEQIQRVVASNDKQRFGLIREGDTWFIRAHQGHSGLQATHLDDEKALTRIEDASLYPFCIHGTTRDAWKLILSSGGLKTMGRRHIHFSSKPFGSSEIISGMRRTSKVLIYVNLAAAMSEGIKFYLSSNDVILTEGVDGALPAKYFSKVEFIRAKGRELAMLDGVPITDLRNPAESSSSSSSAPAGSNSPRRILQKGSSSKQSTRDQSKPIESKSPSLDLVLVLDFEATCDEHKDAGGLAFSPAEIIEFPVVVLDVKTLKEVARFHQYVRPVVHPRLTEFCTRLTGIQQATVDAAEPFPEVWKRFQAFLRDQDLIDDSGNATSARRWTFATCGDWDLKTMLVSQLGLSKLPLPAFCNSWINVKIAFHKLYGMSPSGMTQMLQHLKLPLQGRHHSGIDDVLNITNILRSMITNGYAPRVTFKRKPPQNPKPE